MTTTLAKRFSRVGRQEHEQDPLIIAKFFNPSGTGTWYATEYYPDRKLFFGYVSGLVPGCDEWGYFTLNELEQVRTKPFGLVIERDRFFQEKKFSELRIDLS